MALFHALVLSALLGPDPAPGAASRRAPSFALEVEAVLSKAGCNQGVCHGNRSGKGGFKLSLRGQDPDLDWLALTREASGRRIDLLAPERSLILRKPAAQVPHEGGRRFEPGSWEEEVLRGWISAGAPQDPAGAPRLEALDASPREAVVEEPLDAVQISLRARFSDGTSRDVTAEACYEVAGSAAAVDPKGRVTRVRSGEATVIARFLDRQAPVTVAFVPARPGFEPSRDAGESFIDRLVFAKLDRLRIRPSAVAPDGVFLRRVYLDLLGVLPSAEEAREFLADARPDKRSLLVDRLLARPELADHWALKWSDLLRVEEKTLDAKGVRAFHAWIRRAFAEGKPLDRFARELLAARGSTYAAPETNFYRANRDPISRAEAAAQVFLGVRLGCARCHNHPFDRWTQGDYYSWAAVFARVDYEVKENRRRDTNDSHEFVGEQVVFWAPKGEVTDPRTGKPALPRILGAPSVAVGAGEDRLASLAAWIGSPADPFFAHAQANRIWFQLLGRGIVDPIDDFRATNPPSNPALLDALAEELARSGYDWKALVRAIVTSRTYQLSAEPDETNAYDETCFSRAYVRRLGAEELLDAASRVTGAPLTFRGQADGLRACQLPGVGAVRPRDRGLTAAEEFLKAFGKPPRLISCECERASATTMGQAFQLLSGRALDDLLTRPGNRLAGLAQRPARDAIDVLYWTAFSRAPAGEEAAAAMAAIEAAGSLREGLEDVAWAILTSKEFLLRR